VDSGTLATNSVNSAELIDGAVDNSHLATGIDATKLADGTITNSELQYINSLSSNAQTQINGAGVDGINSSANADAIVISSNEEVTMPYQPCFLANLTSRAENVTGAGAPYTTAGKVFTEIYDIGSNFGNGSFTAPVTGKYILYGSFYFVNTASNMNQTIIYLETSNRGYNFLRSHGYNIFPYQGSFTCSIVGDMDAGDTFWMSVTMYGGSGNTTHIDASSNPSSHSRNGTFMGAALIG
jgi:hypothetical protein